MFSHTYSFLQILVDIVVVINRQWGGPKTGLVLVMTQAVRYSFSVHRASVRLHAEHVVLTKNLPLSWPKSISFQNTRLLKLVKTNRNTFRIPNDICITEVSVWKLLESKQRNGTKQQTLAKSEIGNFVLSACKVMDSVPYCVCN